MTLLDQLRSIPAPSAHAFGWAGVAILACGMVVGMSGCGGVPEVVSNATVSGVVELDGSPTGPVGLIFYSDQLGKIAEAEAGEDGQFTIPGTMPSGGYIVCLKAAVNGKTPTDIPPKYFMDTSTDQRHELQVGSNRLMISLKK